MFTLECQANFPVCFLLSVNRIVNAASTASCMCAVIAAAAGWHSLRRSAGWAVHAASLVLAAGCRLGTQTPAPTS